MGSIKSGNRTSRRRASPEEKSVNASIRLNPRKEGHRWALDYLAAFDAEQERLPMDERRFRGDLVVDALMAYAGHEQEEPTVRANAQDVVMIREIVQYMMDKFESGAYAATGGGTKRKKREPQAQLSDTMQATVDHYIANGFTGSQDLDED